jgi:hypothetical protein
VSRGRKKTENVREMGSKRKHVRQTYIGKKIKIDAKRVKIKKIIIQ